MAASKHEFVVVLTTAGSDEQAASLARELVGRRLAGCVNVVPGVRSVFRWDDRVQEEREALLLVKTRAELAGRVDDAIRELHSYDVPEVVVVPVAGGSEGYLTWLAGETVPAEGSARGPKP